MKCPCGNHAACVPGCALMDYPGYSVYWGEPEPNLNGVTTTTQIAQAASRLNPYPSQLTEADSLQRRIDAVEDDGFRTAYPEMPYSPPLPDVTRDNPEKMASLHASDATWTPDPAPVSSLVDEIDEWYAANDPLMAGAGDGNSPPWVEKTLLDDILEQRGSRYGRFRDNAGIAQMIKDAVRSGLAYGQWADDQKEALDQIAAKLSRAATGDPDYVDNWDDIAGYAKLVAERLREEQK